MNENDTVKLLRECDSGIRMGIDSIDSVIDRVESEDFRRGLEKCREGHEALGHEMEELLRSHGDEGKSPSPMILAMSHVKTEVSLMTGPSDKHVADLMTDGCGMGIKSISKYLNEYKAADEKSRDIAKRLIKEEEGLLLLSRSYL